MSSDPWWLDDPQSKSSNWPQPGGDDGSVDDSHYVEEANRTNVPPPKRFYSEEDSHTNVPQPKRKSKSSKSKQQKPPSGHSKKQQKPSSSKASSSSSSSSPRRSNRAPKSSKKRPSRSTEDRRSDPVDPPSTPKRSSKRVSSHKEPKIVKAPSQTSHRSTKESIRDSWDKFSSSVSEKSAKLSASVSEKTAQLSMEVSQRWNDARSQRSSRHQQQRSKSTLTEGSSSNSDGSGGSDYRDYTVDELIQSLGQPDVDLPDALERRVRDFKFAQGQRQARHGDNKPWGIFGLYAHLSDIRADLEWAEDAAWRRQREQPYLSWTDFEKSRDTGLHNRPLFTYGVIAFCTLMFFVTLGVNGWSVEPLNVNPLIGPSSETLVKVGARQTDLIVNDGQWFRLFTPLVLHAGLVHYIINMGAMYFIGGAVEKAHGFASAAVLFILPAVGGNILSAICLPQYISVGASGGIFGLIGACMADIYLNWNLLFLESTTDDESRRQHSKVLFWLGFDIFINCLLGFTPFVDNFTHLGGFLYGFCCGLSTIEKLGVGFFGLRSNDSSNTKNTFVRFFGLIVSVVAIMVTTVLLVNSDGTTSPCHGCRYISCVPFPPRADEKWWYCDDCDFVTADLYVDPRGSGRYEEIELECPDGQVELVDVSGDEIYDRETIRKELPTYCRASCDDVFAT